MRPFRLAVVLLCLLLPALAIAADHTWSRGTQIPDLPHGRGSVTAAFAGGELHVVTSDRDGKIYHARLKDGQWTAPVNLAYHRSNQGPNLAVCDGVLHMVGRPNNFKIWHSTFDGRAWSDPVEIPAMETRGRVGLTALDGVLHLTHGGMNMDRRRIFHAANSGWGWGHNVALPDQKAKTTADMAGLDGILHMVYDAKSTNTAWHTMRTRWGEWTPPAQIPGVETNRYPSVVKANGGLFYVFTVGAAKLGDQRPVAYCEFVDGRWSPPTTLEGYVCYGAPVAAVEPGLPNKIHLLLPSLQGILHLSTEDKVEVAPMQMKKVQLRK